VLAGRRAGLPVLAWTLPAAVAARLSAETGRGFAGQPPGRIDLCLRVSRRRLQLLGECEHLRWLVPPADVIA
jgi:hypothetical protein